jgi:hypothetical protein
VENENGWLVHSDQPMNENKARPFMSKVWQTVYAQNKGIVK